MTDERVRFEIGFKGGGTTGGELPPDQHAPHQAGRCGAPPRGLGLAAARGVAQGGLVELAGDGSHWFIRTDDVAWLRRGERDRKLGFGTP